MHSVIVFLGLISYTSGLIVSGNVNSETRWQFLARFCFKADAGIFKFKITISGGYNNISSLIPYTEEEWPLVYPAESMSCRDKVSTVDASLPYISRFDFSKRFAGCTQTQEATATSLAEYTCEGGKTFPSTTRERWWYIALESCAHPKRVEAQYKLTLVNDEEKFFFKHYSADEFYILQTDIVFLIFYILLALLSVFVAWSLKKIQMYHLTYQVYMGSLLLEVSSLCVLVGYWAEYGRTGIPNKTVKFLGIFLELWSSIMFIVVLILMGKGYSVTRSWISTAGKVKMAIFVICYIIAAISVFIADAVMYDPGLVLYLYASIPGYVLIVMKFIALFWFLYGIFFTFKNFPEKRRFYLPFTLIFVFWFILGPIVTLSAVGTPAWTREKVVNGVNLAVILFGHLVFMWITWPSLANKNFPFTVKRTTITVDGKEPQETYAPGGGGENIPLPRRSHNMFTATNGETN